MRTRIIAGLLLVPLLILIIVGGTPLYIGEAIIISIALHEFYKAFEAKDIKPLYYIGYIFSIYLLIKNYLKLPITFTYTLIFILFLILVFIIYCSLAFKYQITPWKVWRLAHGKMPARSMKEEKILRKLKEAKIIVDIV